MSKPTLQDRYQFLIKMHGNEEAAKADFYYFMAGKLPEHLIEYCRQAVAAERVKATGCLSTTTSGAMLREQELL